MPTVTFARSAQLLWEGDVVRGSGKALPAFAIEVLPEIGEAAKRECTISNAIGGSVEVTYEVAST